MAKNESTEFQVSNEEVMSLEETRQLNAELEERVRQRAAELGSASDELRRERDRVRHYLDVMGATMVALDAQGKVTLVNRSGCELLGLTEQEILGKDWFEHFIPERLRSEVHQVFDQIMSGECASVANFENPIRRADGEERLIRWHNSELADDAGHVIGVLSSGIDVTERRQAEQAVRDSEQRLKAIVETAADAIITIDEQGIIDSVNSTTERLFGYRQEELIGRNVKMLMPPPHCDEHDEYLARYLKTGQAKIIGIGREVEGRRKDGTVFPIDLAVSELQDGSGRLFTGIIRDITERKADQARFVQSERLAALGEAMAGLTHESRNALARSQGNLQRLARRLKGNQELLQLIEGAIRANDDVRRQFEEVREYAAPIHLRLEPLRLPEVVQKAWDELAPDRKGRKATLRIDRSDFDVTCAADAFSLRNVFRNILENSLAACDDPVEIDIEFRDAKIGGSPALRISIRDNGPGLPSEVLERAFDAFYTTKTRGTGLGLAIVKRAVEAHGGEVAFDSGRGRGTEITITLPRNRNPSR